MDRTILPRVERLINDAENADSIQKIRNLKKLSGFKTYYRVRVGDYRIGIEKIDEVTIRFITLAHRKEIYKIFP